MRRAMVSVGLLLPLLAGCDSLWRWTTQPFRLSCRLEAGSAEIFRIDPRRQLVEELDPATGEVTGTITTTTPPPELGGGIIDDSTVRITPRQIHWETSMYRPQFARESHSIDLPSLTYTAQWNVQVDAGPEVSETRETGRCARI
ncbi:MAG: hypothetical protein VKJ66_06865 [Synechococcus sp.]|nr:hypothetical protein [Synechococcus sp.]